MARLIEKIKIEATIKLFTGLHIGGNTDNVEIGGIDNPVIKLANKGGQPYIPGSSLKGKMRALMEQSRGISKPGEIGEIEEKNPKLLKVRDFFGFATNKDSKPSRLIVRDAVLTAESESELRNNPNLDMPYVEKKSENTIDRITARANPRSMERVPAGAVFNVEFVINKWREDGNNEVNDNKELDMLYEAIRLLENDYLGGSGSRGYGQLKIDITRETVLSAENNWK